MLLIMDIWKYLLLGIYEWKTDATNMPSSVLVFSSPFAMNDWCLYDNVVGGGGLALCYSCEIFLPTKRNFEALHIKCMLNNT